MLIRMEPVNDIFFFFQNPHQMRYRDKAVTAREIIFVDGSVPLVPYGIEVDGTNII